MRSVRAVAPPPEACLRSLGRRGRASPSARAVPPLPGVNQRRAHCWGHGGATSGPRTTGSQRTTPVNTGPPSAKVIGHTPPTAAGRGDPSAVPDTEGVTGSNPVAPTTNRRRSGRVRGPGLVRRGSPLSPGQQTGSDHCAPDSRRCYRTVARMAQSVDT
jgi:hypothetical protein